MSTETISLIRDGGKGVWRWGEREIIYLSLHCHHQNDFCIKVGSDVSHFNVSLIVRDKVTRQRPQTTTFEEKGEPKQIRTKVLTARPNRVTQNSCGMSLLYRSSGLPYTWVLQPIKMSQLAFWLVFCVKNLNRVGHVVVFVCFLQAKS